MGDTDNQSFRSIVTANEGMIPGTVNMHDVVLGAHSDRDSGGTQHDHFIARLQAQSPMSRRERRIRSSAAKWRRQSVGYSRKQQVARLGRPRRVPTSIAPSNERCVEHSMDREEGEIPALLEESLDELDTKFRAEHASGINYDDSISPAVRCKSQSSTGVKGKKARGRGRISVCGTLPISPGEASVAAMNSSIISSSNGDNIGGSDDSLMLEASMTEQDGNDIDDVQSTTEEPMDALDNEDDFIISTQHDFRAMIVTSIQRLLAFMHGASGHMWWVARTSSALMVILP